METPAITTMVKLMESLPEEKQNLVLEHLRRYVAELQEDLLWNDAFLQTKDNLVNAAQGAKKQIRENQAKPFDPARL
jgi:hypothetical protein